MLILTNPQRTNEIPEKMRVPESTSNVNFHTIYLFTMPNFDTLNADYFHNVQIAVLKMHILMKTISKKARNECSCLQYLTRNLLITCINWGNAHSSLMYRPTITNGYYTWIPSYTSRSWVNNVIVVEVHFTNVRNTIRRYKCTEKWTFDVTESLKGGRCSHAWTLWTCF